MQILQGSKYFKVPPDTVDKGLLSSVLNKYLIVFWNNNASLSALQNTRALSVLAMKWRKLSRYCR